MKYMVVECHVGYVVLLDERGNFLKAANFQYQLGQTVENPVLMQSWASLQKRRGRIARLAALAACFVFAFGILFYQLFAAVHSSVFLSINPAVQMDLNRMGKVVRLRGVNADGVALLKGYDGEGLSQLDAALQLVDRAAAMGFLEEDGQVSLAIDAPNEELFQDYSALLRSGIEGHLEGQTTVTVQVIRYTPDWQPGQPISSSDAQTGSGGADYNDTDYGPNSDGVTDYDTDYGPDSDGVTDYGDSDYDFDDG